MMCFWLGGWYWVLGCRVGLGFDVFWWGNDQKRCVLIGFCEVHKVLIKRVKSDDFAFGECGIVSKLCFFHFVAQTKFFRTLYYIIGGLLVRTPSPQQTGHRERGEKKTRPNSFGGKSKRGVGAVWVVILDSSKKKQTQKHRDRDETQKSKTQGRKSPVYIYVCVSPYRFWRSFPFFHISLCVKRSIVMKTACTQIKKK